MPWKVSSVMEERLRFVARLLEGESMSEVCRCSRASDRTGHYGLMPFYGHCRAESSLH